MNRDRLFTVFDCVRSSSTGDLAFPQIIVRLAEIGVERYHADYTRSEKTFYFTDGESLLTPLLIEPRPIATEFSKTAVEAAVRQSQRNEHTYADFLRKTIAAGCVGYFVHITGHHAIYFGRKAKSTSSRFRIRPVVDRRGTAS